MAWRFALLLLVAIRTWGCVCGGNWPSAKQAWQNSPFVFLGTVEIADPDDDPRQTMFREQSVRIRVDEAFKGVSNGKTIEMRLGASDCDAKFRTGQHAVFYLAQGWIVPPCSHSIGSAEPTGDDLLFLRGLPASAVGTRLSGEIELYEDTPKQAVKRIGGVPNVKVTVHGPNGFTREVLTNAAGAYEMFGLEPEKYRVSIEVPKGLKIYFPLISGSPSIKGEKSTIELGRNAGASVGFVLKADTQLSGRLLDAKGAPIKDVCIDLEPEEGRGENGARFFDCSKKDGVFKMEMMPPGTYVLVARDKIKVDGFESESTLYYPGVRDRVEAKRLSIEAGKYVDHVDIRLPASEQRFKISGRMQFADGVPVEGATVTFTSPQHGYSEKTTSGHDGLFALSVIAGMEGQLAGRLAVMEPILKSCPNLQVEPIRRGIFRFMDANPISISADSDHRDLKLDLPSTSCKSWPTVRR